MSKANNISSLSELRERREEIKTEQQAARRGLTSTLAAAPQKAKEYALEDLALPALGIGLAAYVSYRVLRSNNQPEPAPQETAFVEPPQQNSQPQPQPQPQVSTAYTPPQAQAPPYQAPRQFTPQQEQTQQVVKKSFNFATVIAAGKLLIPAAQAIIGVIQNQQSKEQTKEQLQGAKREIVSEVEDK